MIVTPDDFLKMVPKSIIPMSVIIEMYFDYLKVIQKARSDAKDLKNAYECFTFSFINYRLSVGIADMEYAMGPGNVSCSMENMKRKFLH